MAVIPATMTEAREFVRETRDLSTERGFQFEFACDRCAQPYRSRIRSWADRPWSRTKHALALLLGGIFLGEGETAQGPRSRRWQREREAARIGAIEELRGNFALCPGCGQWVCRRSCWEERRGLCRDCAPGPRA